MADTEIVDIVDNDNNIIGSASVLEAHNKRLLHRAVGIFVFDIDGSLYIQTGNKYNRLDLSVGGHVQQGETYESAAKREMLEEIGLDVPMQPVTTFLPTDARLGHYWRLYTATAPKEWKFSATEEVSALSKMDMNVIKNDMKLNPESFTHGFMNVMTEMLRVRNL